MTDRELLDLAAKAAGWMPNNNWKWSERAEAFRYCLGGDWVEWNPLTKDGDALRLAVKLQLNICAHSLPHAINVVVYDGRGINASESLADVRLPTIDPYAATRRAIVRAAAEIWRAMK